MLHKFTASLWTIHSCFPFLFPFFFFFLRLHDSVICEQCLRRCRLEPKFFEKDNLQVIVNLQICSTTNLELTYRLSFFSFKKLGLWTPLTIYLGKKANILDHIYISKYVRIFIMMIFNIFTNTNIGFIIKGQFYELCLVESCISLIIHFLF